MSLILENIDHVVNGEAHIEGVNLELAPGSFNVLLGRTLAGKTTLMRIMAGLEQPTAGRVLMHGEDVTGVSVRRRNVSMVYQQFINYPSLTVFDNIASPLKLAKVVPEEVRQRVHDTASMLHIEHLLDRYPLELSGGQQQRTAMGRALVKDADLILFDEPLVNLDYKLREEFREELRELFRARNCIAVYATTEPNEALALGGNTAVLHEGKMLQYGPTEDVYHRPRDILTAEMFSEPPINVVPAMVSGSEVTFDRDVRFPLNDDLKTLAPGQYQFGVRASHISLTPQSDDDLEIEVRVDIAEISGSETFLHVHNDLFHLVLHLTGIHEFAVDQDIKVYFPTHKIYAFDHGGGVVHIPKRIGAQ
ncbi:ABC transporter ATP-binding protein [Halomonas urumqiensis]|uniref:ABC transporter ATP-binding protein n=1 Tax=Halomonas urumqiensis TaxID=1684789 RepID=A0A2N7UKR0_9GAMM|nr:ABC transporter ATP-binding protein [Halomonas urumqiensis]PMR81033.1 ABC transporter ATP-binding protein [Halomonas urumqiensis]PTB01110.1 ABC transporter ATP-binding protein [Halomonas urumqiensis]GHE22838.1 ABC transporter ATP-binding protein [Halomonas urumqiensis]